MSLIAYLFEKACYPPESLAWLAQDLRAMQVEPTARRELESHVQVALRYALRLACDVAGAELDAGWALRLLREGERAWEDVVRPELTLALFGASSTEPGEALPLRDDDELDPEDLIEPALRCVAAFLDLAEVVRRREPEGLDGASLRRRLVVALNGATKVVSTFLDGPWEDAWPRDLASGGRSALATVVAAWQTARDVHVVRPSDLAPLDEAWLAEADPTRSTAGDQDLERRRRAAVTAAGRMPGDLIPPLRLAHASLERLAASDRPEHQACVAYARDPRGVLVLQGRFRSALHAIQFAIGRHWFVQDLALVRAARWTDLVERNLLAQSRALREAPRLLLCELFPVHLDDGVVADPGHADRLLAHRLEHALPTVVTVEHDDLDAVGLHLTTLDRLRTATTVRLPVLDEAEAAALGLSF